MTACNVKGRPMPHMLCAMWVDGSCKLSAPCGHQGESEPIESSVCDAREVVFSELSAYSAQPECCLRLEAGYVFGAGAVLQDLEHRLIAANGLRAGVNALLTERNQLRDENTKLMLENAQMRRTLDRLKG